MQVYVQFMGSNGNTAHWEVSKNCNVELIKLKKYVCNYLCNYNYKQNNTLLVPNMTKLYLLIAKTVEERLLLKVLKPMKCLKGPRQ